MGRAWPGFLDVSSLARAVWLPGWPGVPSSTPREWWPSSLDYHLQVGLSVLDAVVWPLVVAVESVALAAMLCFFFLFCGCNL